LTISDNEVEVVGSFKYLGSVIDSTSDKTGDIKVRILPIKRITLCKLYLDLNKFPEIIKEDYIKINQAGTVLRKCSMDCNTNDRTYVIRI
jgi:hypothetical protein